MEGTLSLFEWAPGWASAAAPAVDPMPARRPKRARAKAEPVTAPAPLPLPRPEPVSVSVSVSVSASASASVSAPVTATSRVVIFDVETTGTDRGADQVIELCVQRGLGADATSQTWRIKPTCAIHPGALAVHGITPEALADCPAFAQVADAIVAVFAEADVIVGYNLAFDIDMLQAEYARANRPPLELGGKTVVDPFRLWQQCEPRSLQHAHQRFVGNEFAAAHSASADVAATGRVLEGMLRAFKLDGQDWTAIASVCDPSRASWVGPSRHLRWEADVIVLGFGKHAGAPLHALAAGPDRGFLRWVLDKDFPTHVGELCKAALERSADELHAWARARFAR